MKPNRYETVLKETPAPAPAPEARVLAKRAALEEFARVQAAEAAPIPEKRGFFQGLLAGLRLSRDGQSHGKDVMSLNARTRMFAGAAGVCIAVIGLAIVWPMFQAGDTKRAIQQASEQTSERPVPAEAARAELRAPDARLPEMTEPAEIEPQAAEPAIDVRDAAPAAPAESKDERVQAPPAPEQSREAQDAGASAATTEKAKEDKSADTETLSNVIVTQQIQSVPLSKKQEEQPEMNQIEEVRVAGARASRRNGGSPKNAAAAPVSGSGYAFGRTFTPKEVEKAASTARDDHDKFEHFDLNAVKQTADDRFSTFSADVDTSSYSFVRKQLNAGVLPQKDAVRSEEMINYFDYAWPAAESRERPFRPTVVVTDSPWGKGRKLVHIGIKGYELDARQRPDANLVMLLDVSGSMDQPDKLPLVKESMRLMVNALKPTDTVAIVVYAGAAGTVLPPTPVGKKDEIFAALDRLQAGGSTAGAAGIELAYQLAESSFRKDGVNRILLCTDGDFNVGIDGTDQLKGFVERKRSKGVFLSVLGFGQGNYRDELAQALAQNGNGVAAYIDTLSEAQKVLVHEAGASLFTIAKDVKLQVEFNPATVAEYRLVGYETRALKREDFNNDAVDAGDVGSGHSVTAIYEITPVGVDARMVDAGRYASKDAQARAPVVADGKAGEYGFLRIRYNLPKSNTSQLIEEPIGLDKRQVPEAISRDVQFSTAVAGFAQLLRGGQYTGALTYDDVIKQALAARGEDPYGYRNEFVQLVRRAQGARE